jgi:lipoprotein signal peptidase
MRKVCKQKIRKRGLWDGSTWATTYNTGACFSVSSDDKLVLFLFPGIPTGDPAIVAFYDKRIYKKVTIEVIVPKWSLISRKETASEYDKINNFAMIRRSFVTIEGQFLSVITVINMLHFFNQLIVYTIWKLAFSKPTKITPLTCSPFYQYNVCHDVTYQ